MRRNDEQLVLSSNTKTGESLNLDRRSCRPTRLCAQICYGRGVSAAEARRTGIHANWGPITWPAQQAAYRRNRELLERMSSLEIQAEALRIAASLEAQDLRLCGMGDLTPELVELIAWLAHFGVRPWGFTKRPEMLGLLCRAMKRIPPAAGAWPMFQGSTDSTMELSRIAALESWTRRLNALGGREGRATLAYVTLSPGWIGAAEVDALPWRSSVATVFGYHTNSHKTVVAHQLACPSTNGEEVKCRECRRCIDGMQ